MVKQCSKCKIIKDENNFFKRADNQLRLQSHCKGCQNIYARKQYNNLSREDKELRQKNKKQRLEKIRDWLCTYLSTHSCVDCGEKDIVVLTFDHLRDKELEVSSMVNYGYGIKKIEAEIKKCEVVCANCHARRTAKTFKTYKHMF